MKEPLLDRVARLVAKHLPRRVRYWALIDMGVKAIRSDEVVPDVPFVDVLNRTPRI